MSKTMDFIEGSNIRISTVGSTEADKRIGISMEYFVGELYYQLVIRPGFVWANGQVLSNVSANYPKLKAWLKDSGSYGGAFLRKTLTEWNAEWNDAKWNAPDTSGNRAGMSPYYVLDESANTIKVPDLRGAYLGACGFNGQVSGATLNDATRNIYGVFGVAAGGGRVRIWNASGAFQGHGDASTTTTYWANGIEAPDGVNLSPYGRINTALVVPTDVVNHPRTIASYLCLYAGPA